MEKILEHLPVWMILIFASILTGCAASPESQENAQLAESASSPAGDVDESRYLIGPGDILNIFVWRNTDISVTVPVRPDGRISTPLVKDILASGKTPEQLGHDIETVLSEYIRSPVVTVIVTNFVGTFSEQIRVVGQASEPRSLPFRENISVLDVMIEVGGLAEFAAGNRAKIIRKSGDKEIEINVRLEDLLENGDISANMMMNPGDILIIPESWW